MTLLESSVYQWSAQLSDKVEFLFQRVLEQLSVL